MAYLEEALRKAKLLTLPQKTNSNTKSDDDLVLELAIAKVDGQVPSDDTQTPEVGDKGLFGNRQIEFVQEVYYLPNKPSGDHSQPIGLLTLSDLNNYCLYRKNDRLTFRYKEGSSGSCTYEAKKNGQSDFACEFDWSDALIQELIDEGACKLI